MEFIVSRWCEKNLLEERKEEKKEKERIGEKMYSGKKRENRF